MKRSSSRLETKVVRFFDKICHQLSGLAAFELRLPSLPVRQFGEGVPVFAITVNNQKGLSAITTRDEAAIAEAYVAGDLDLEGDLPAMYSLRNALTDRHPLWQLWWVRLQPLLFGQVNRDKKWIAHHYDWDQEFYLLFLDSRHRCYSQAVFQSEDESLEEGMTRKLQFALESCQASPGQRILDIGGGWGAFTEHAGRQGMRVTSLTISQESQKFMERLIEEQKLPCKVLLEHFYEHQSDQPYDAIVNLGVTEHLPDYRRTLEHCHRLLKPGGRLYLDASAAREKFSFSSFIYRHIYPGNPTPMCMAEYVAEIERSPFELLALHNDRLNYERTARCWAENLERARATIVDRWGVELYRKFRLYIWGTVHAFATNLMSAYRLVLENPACEADLRRWVRRSQC